LVVHIDQFQGVPGRCWVVRGHDCDRLACEPDFVDGHREVVRDQDVFGDGPGGGDTGPFLLQLRTGEHAYHTRVFTRRRGIDGRNFRVRELTAQYCQVHCSGQFDVVGPVRLPGRQGASSLRGTDVPTIRCGAWST